ncbi:TerB family tellurite resistance protein [Alteromonas sp. ASW11-19]|uniref:TerB family tellurite resistance protein n=1 Tax=Alteromonas salexigens TaxID=2982530 RepID=A0ABT2VPF2_9ALTE|nr:TerB family tellurite resistance protein [Alteromonas salexigens]MCU7555187.1 TerB family tellurite resistance protein [Alteromonas salexigens]
MYVTPQQAFNEALIRMSVLLYQADGMVTLTEQDYLDEFIDSLDWQSPISESAFLNNAIYETRKALDVGDGEKYLKALQQDLLFDADKAMEVAMAITGADGERCDEEAELLTLLTHKLLAKALVSCGQPNGPGGTAPVSI